MPTPFTFNVDLSTLTLYSSSCPTTFPFTPSTCDAVLDSASEIHIHYSGRATSNDTEWLGHISILDLTGNAAAILDTLHVEYDCQFVPDDTIDLTSEVAINVEADGKHSTSATIQSLGNLSDDIRDGVSDHFSGTTGTKLLGETPSSDGVDLTIQLKCVGGHAVAGSGQFVYLRNLVLTGTWHPAFPVITIDPGTEVAEAGTQVTFTTNIDANFTFTGGSLVVSGGTGDGTDTLIWLAPNTPGTYTVRATDIAHSGNFIESTITVPAHCVTVNTIQDADKLIRSVPAGLQVSLEGMTPALCICVRLQRKDGEVFGFTTHDEDLTFGGDTYEALSSVQATTLRQQSGTGIDNMDVTGLLSSDRITESDLRAQRFDAAEIKLYVVDWITVADRLLVLRGTLGEVTLTDGQYRAEIRSLMQRYAQQVGKLTSPICRWFRFCDSNCALNIADFTFAATVDSIASVARVFYASVVGSWPTIGNFNYGVARATSGDNAGIEREIKDADLTGTSRRFELQEAFPYPIAPADTFDLEEGCDRKKETCLIYSNIVNFGGEPYVPGTDAFNRVGRHKT